VVFPAPLGPIKPKMLRTGSYLAVRMLSSFSIQRIPELGAASPAGLDIQMELTPVSVTVVTFIDCVYCDFRTQTEAIIEAT
jgi:hypothetical protein